MSKRRQNSRPPQNTSAMPGKMASNSVTIEEAYRGPLPHPTILQGYGTIDPSFPECVFTEFEKNSQHHREQEQQALVAQMNDVKRGQWMAFSIITMGLAGTLVLAYLGKDAAAVCTALGTVAMIFKGMFNKK